MLLVAVGGMRGAGACVWHSDKHTLAHTHRPLTLQQVLQVKADHPDAKLVVGNTEIGVEVKFKNLKYAHLISPTLVAQLHKVSFAVVFL